MAADKNGSKMDGVVKLVIIFFVCLLSFSIGTFVGKKFSDNQHKVAEFEPTNQDREIASVNPEAGDVKPSEALSDDEVAKLAEEFVSDETKSEEGHEGAPLTDKNSEVREAKADAHGKGHGAEAEETSGHGEKKTEAKEKTAHAAPAAAEHGEKTTAAHGEPMKAATSVAHDESPEKTETVVTTTKSRIPSSLPKQLADSPSGKYTVQIAAFPEENEARKMATDLKAKKFSAFYVAAKVKDRKTNVEKTWYRVNVGMFSNQKEADTYKKDLLNHSKVPSAIVSKVSE